MMEHVAHRRHIFTYRIGIALIEHSSFQTPHKDKSFCPSTDETTPVSSETNTSHILVVLMQWGH